MTISSKRKINLYVDDSRDCPEGFEIARSVKEAINYLENYDIEILSLDHDLGEDENGELLSTGYDLVKYFCNNGFSAEKIYIHTDNSVGRENMYQTLIGAQRRGFISSKIEIYNFAYVPNRYTEKCSNVISGRRKIMTNSTSCRKGVLK